MAANTAPIFVKTPLNQWIGAVTAANTTKDLTSGTIYLVATADVTNGSRIDKLLVQPLGTNVASVLRVWLNNSSSTGTAANNTYIRDFTLPAVTVSEVASMPGFEFELDLVMKASYRLYVTLGTVVAAGYGVTAVGGDY